MDLRKILTFQFVELFGCWLGQSGRRLEVPHHHFFQYLGFLKGLPLLWENKFQLTFIKPPGRSLLCITQGTWYYFPVTAQPMGGHHHSANENHFGLSGSPMVSCFTRAPPTSVRQLSLPRFPGLVRGSPLGCTCQVAILHCMWILQSMWILLERYLAICLRSIMLSYSLSH